MTKRNMKNAYQGTMRTVQHCQTRWTKKLRGAATQTRAECANHRVVVDGLKTHHLMATPIRNEDFARRRHNGDTPGIRQRAGGSRQLSHPGAIRRPQHCHTMVVAIHNEKEGLVWSQRQTTWPVELAGLIALRSDGALPLALHLMRAGKKKQKQNNYITNKTHTYQKKQRCFFKKRNIPRGASAGAALPRARSETAPRPHWVPWHPTRALPGAAAGRER
jgi:hypothetical protein